MTFTITAPDGTVLAITAETASGLIALVEQYADVDDDDAGLFDMADFLSAGGA